MVLEHLAVSVDFLSCRCLFLRWCVQVGFHFLLDSLEAVLQVLAVDALRRQLARCRVRVAVRASPLP